MEVVGGSRSRSDFFWKIFTNSPKPVLIFWSCIPCVLYTCRYIAKIYWLLWFEISVHICDEFPKNWMDDGWVEEFYLSFLGNFLTLQGP